MLMAGVAVVAIVMAIFVYLTRASSGDWPWWAEYFLATGILSLPVTMALAGTLLVSLFDRSIR
jgi:hypothetical protein